MKRWNLTILLLVISMSMACGGSAPPAPAVPAPEPVQPGLSVKVVPPGNTDAGLDRVHEATLDFYAGDLTKLHDRFSPEFARSLPLEQLVALRRHVADKYGKEVAVLGEESKSNAQYRGYVRWAKFDKIKDPMEVQWILKPDDTIAGFFIRPAKTESKKP